MKVLYFFRLLCLGIGILLIGSLPLLGRAQIVTPPTGRFADVAFCPDPWPTAYNQYNSVFDIGAQGRKPGDYIPRWILGAPGFRHDIAFRGTWASNGTFAFHILQYSSTLAIDVFVDGSLKGSVNVAAGPQAYNTLNKEYAVAVPSGTHTVQLVNSSGGDFEADWYRIPNLRGLNVHLIVTPAQRLSITIKDKAVPNTSPAQGWFMFTGSAAEDIGQRQTSYFLGVDGHPEITSFKDYQFSSVNEFVPEIYIPSSPADLQSSATATVQYIATLANADFVPGPPLEQQIPLTPMEFSLYTKPDSIYDYTDPDFAKWVSDRGLKRAANEDLLEFAFRVLSQEVLEFSYIEDTGRPASEVLKLRQGSCGGLSNVFSAVMRANGIPARVPAGRYIATAPPNPTAAYHGKAQIFDSRHGWIYVETATPVSTKFPYGAIGTMDGGFFAMLHGGVYIQTWPIGMQDIFMEPLNQAYPSNVVLASSVDRLPLIDPDIKSISPLSNTIVGGNSVSGLAVLSMNSLPNTGSWINLKSSSAAVNVPATVYVPPGTDRATFQISSGGVSTNTTSTITATCGLASVSATLTILPAAEASLTLLPSAIVDGATSTGKVTLTGTAGPGGVVVKLTNGDANSITIPGAVRVPEGTSSVKFVIRTLALSDSKTVKISANANGASSSAELTVNPPGLRVVSISPTSIIGGSSTDAGVVNLVAPAPPGGAVVSLISNSALAVVPTTVIVPAGSTTASFSVKSLGVDQSTPVTISAAFGSATKSCVVTVQPATVSSVAVMPTKIFGGSSSPVIATVNVYGLAGPSGLVVTLSSSNTLVAKVPASITVPSGASSGNFKVMTYGVKAPQTITLTAASVGNSATTTLTVLPSNIAGLTISPASIVGGNVLAKGMVTLASAAPKGGVIVALSSSKSCVTIPQTITIPAGATSAIFTGIATTGVNLSTPVLVTASLTGETKAFTETVLSASLLTFSLSASTVKGGASTNSKATLNGCAGPAGAVITLKCSDTSAVTVPGTVKVASNARSATFTVISHAVNFHKSVNITATYGGKTQNVSLVVTP